MMKLEQIDRLLTHCEQYWHDRRCKEENFIIHVLRIKKNRLREL